MLITAATMSKIKEAPSCTELACYIQRGFSRDNYLYTDSPNEYIASLHL